MKRSRFVELVRLLLWLALLVVAGVAGGLGFWGSFGGFAANVVACCLGVCFVAGSVFVRFEL